MANLIDFYRKVVDTVGLSSNKEGIIFAGKGDKKVPMVVSGKTLVIPTKHQLSTIMEKDEDGKLVVSKIPFNPLNEDVVKGDSISLKKTRQFVEKNLGHSIAVAGRLLILLAEDKALQAHTTTEINKFLKLVNKANTVHNTQKGRSVVDAQMAETWGKLYLETLKSEGFVKLALVKGGKINGVKYNRVASLICPLYDALQDAEPDTPVFGVKLRKKDIVIYKNLIEYLIPGIEADRVVHATSNDKKSPAFISLFKLYLPMIERLNRINRALAFINEEEADSGYIATSITEEDIDDLSIYTSELYTIPDENDLNRDMVSKNKASAIPDVDPKSFNNSGPVISTGNPILDDAGGAKPVVAAPVQPVVYQQPVVMAPVVQQPVQQEVDPVLAAANQAVMTGHGIMPAYQPSPYGQPGYGYAQPNRYVTPAYAPPAPTYGNYGGYQQPNRFVTPAYGAYGRRY